MLQDVSFRAMASLFRERILELGFKLNIYITMQALPGAAAVLRSDF